MVKDENNERLGNSAHVLVLLLLPAGQWLFMILLWAGQYPNAHIEVKDQLRRPRPGAVIKHFKPLGSRTI